MLQYHFDGSLKNKNINHIRIELLKWKRVKMDLLKVNK